MELGLINSAWFGSSLDPTDAGLRMTKQIGYDTADVLLDPMETSDQEIERIRKLGEELHLPFRAATCVSFALSDFNNVPRAFAVKRVNAHVDLARRLGARNLVLALGEYYWEHVVIPTKQMRELAVDSLKRIGEYALKQGVTIALEIEPFKESIFNTVDGLVSFLADVQCDAVRANVDCSHLWLMRKAGVKPEDIGKLRGRVAHVHFSDCNGEVHGDLPPGRGNTPLRTYLGELKKAGFDGTISLELEYAPDPAAIVDWVTEAYRETARMMDELGVRSAKRA
ncbi:MAG: sugar phosphate isomerase/epimerase [Spirochaetia bacterium]|jgi:sugar phosphate isomerase/epimerase